MKVSALSLAVPELLCNSDFVEVEGTHVREYSQEKWFIFWYSAHLFVPLHPSIKSSARKGNSPTEQNVATVVSTMRKQ